MQVGESVAINIAEVAGAERGPCWFCKEERHAGNKENKTESDPQTETKDDEDYPPENDVKNDASSLGENLKDRPQWVINRPGDEVPTTIIPGAHHLIPGNASLKKEMDNGLKDFMCKDGQYNLESDIGYDVNASTNGVWLPGNYQVRPGNEDYTKKWSAYSDEFKNEYSARAMHAANAQFHDAHTDYNKNVRKSLEHIKEKMILPDNNKCPICGSDNHNKTRPPFGLISRLNFVSQQHRQMLVGLGYKKSRKLTMIQNGYHTSSRAYVYFGLNKQK